MSDQQQDQSYRYGGQGFSGVPGGVALNAGSGGFGGEKYAGQGGNQPGQQTEQSKPAQDSSDAYRYGGQGFSGVPGGVALNPGSGGFGGEKFAGQAGNQAGGQAEQAQQQEQSYRYGGQGFSGVPGGVAIEAGAGHFGGPTGHAASDGQSHHHSHHHGEGGAAAGGTIAPGTGHAHHKHEHHDHNERRG